MADQALDNVMLRELLRKKRLRPAARREAVGFMQERFGAPQRRACGLIGIAASTLRYKPRARDDEQVRLRLTELARARSRFGYRRLHVLLRREGFAVNHKRVLRLYRLAGLSLRRQKRKLMPGLARGAAELPTKPNECWALDFVSDALAWGRRIRCLTVVIASRESRRRSRSIPRCPQPGGSGFWMLSPYSEVFLRRS